MKRIFLTVFTAVTLLLVSGAGLYAEEVSKLNNKEKSVSIGGKLIDSKSINGTWQTIVDGQPGEGALFFRLKFRNDGTAEVTKQFGGHDTIVEEKIWSVEENRILVQSADGDAINDFDGAVLTLKSKKTMAYKKGAYVGVVKPYSRSGSWIHFFLILIVLIALNELFRKSKKASIAFYILLPLAMTPLVWSHHGVTYWFKWVKLYSVVFAAVWFTFMRFTSLHKNNWAKLICALFLAVNIAEAVMQDFSMGYLPNLLNGIAGVLSIVTLFYGWKSIAPDNTKEKDMVWPLMTTFWIIAYDIWNWVYVYLNFPGSASAQFMVLLSCTLPALFIKKGTWLQARAFTLAAWFIYYFTFPRFTEQMELLVPRSYNLMLLVAVISIAANAVYALIYFRMLYRERKAEEAVLSPQG